MPDQIDEEDEMNIDALIEKSKNMQIDEMAQLLASIRAKRVQRTEPKEKKTPTARKKKESAKEAFRIVEDF